MIATPLSSIDSHIDYHGTFGTPPHDINPNAPRRATPTTPAAAETPQPPRKKINGD